MEIMNHKQVAITILLIAVVLASAYLLISYRAPLSDEDLIRCPRDGSPYIWTPIGTRSENFLWRCLKCGYTWRKTYPDNIYKRWLKSPLKPDFVRDYTLLYLRCIRHLEIPDPLTLDWRGGRNASKSTLNLEVYSYYASYASNLFISIKYHPAPENVTYVILVKSGNKVVWKEGSLYNRRFISSHVMREESSNLLKGNFHEVSIKESFSSNTSGDV